MSEEIERTAPSGLLDRRMLTYCLIPAELGPQLHALLRRHFADDPGIVVVVERRADERRALETRRGPDSASAAEQERRLVHSRSGRRLSERRAVTAAAEDLPPLPRRARRYADRLTFIERLEPSTEEVDDADAGRLVVAFQAGDEDAFTTLYTRYFDRVYGYLLVVLGRRQDAEDAAQHVFVKALEALPRFEQRGQPFRGWLFRIARNHSLDILRRDRRIEPVDIDELNDARARNETVELEPQTLGWITDGDLMLFIERLPLAQRQALVLRYVVDLSDRQIAAILDRSPEDVRVLQHRAISFLRKRLAAVGRGSKRGGRSRIRRRGTEATVLRMRRFALHP